MDRSSSVQSETAELQQEIFTQYRVDNAGPICRFFQ